MWRRGNAGVAPAGGEVYRSAEATGKTAGGRRELAAVGALLAASATATVVTYSRLPPEELYHTSVDGLAGGLGRALVFTNYPTALLAVPVALLAADRLRPSRGASAVALVAVALCLLTPFVVDQADLDARPANAIPALGVVLTIALVAHAWRRFEGRGGRLAGDRARIVLAAALAAVAIPWLFADLGFYAPDPFLADERPPGEELRAVHLGRHHGMEGVLMALGALAFSRLLPAAHGRLCSAASFLLALTLVYGLANAAEDGWTEQIEKRGWADGGLPTVIVPAVSVPWAVIVAGAAAVHLLWFRREGERAAQVPAAAPAARSG